MAAAAAMAAALPPTRTGWNLLAPVPHGACLLSWTPMLRPVARWPAVHMPMLSLRDPSAYFVAPQAGFDYQPNWHCSKTNFVIDLTQSDISRDAAMTQVAWVLEDERVSRVAIIKGGAPS